MPTPKPSLEELEVLIKQLVRPLAADIRRQIPGDTTFILFLSNGPWMTHAANGQRADVIEALREYCDKAEGVYVGDTRKEIEALGSRMAALLEDARVDQLLGRTQYRALVRQLRGVVEGVGGTLATPHDNTNLFEPS